MTRIHIPAGRLCLVVASLAAAGCSSLTPQIFSERLVASKDANGQWTSVNKGAPPTLEATIQDVAQVQGRYLGAVESQGNSGPVLSAGLIGLSALALFKGITGANTRDMAGAGVAGSTAWAVNSTLVSAPRRDIYRAGAQALGCALTAAEPMRVIEKRLGSADDAAGTDTLHGRYKSLLVAQSALRRQLIQHAALTESRRVQTEPAKAAWTERLKVPPSCKAPAADASPEDKLAFKVCQQGPGTTKTINHPAEPAVLGWEAPPAELLKVYKAAQDRSAASVAHQQQALRAIESTSGAAQALWQQSLDVQLAVSQEVEKTVPNTASVFAAIKGMREVGFTLTGATALAPAARDGAAQSGNRAGDDKAARLLVREAAPDDNTAIRELRQATQAVELAQEALDALSVSLAASNPPQIRAALSECRLRATGGVAINVTPPGPSVSVAAGSSQAFFVSGGSGVPSATVVDGLKPGPLPLKIEGGRFRFDLALPADAVVGTHINLRFADGAGQAERQIEVQVGAAAAAASAPAAAPACAPRTKFTGLTSADLKVLKLDGCVDDAAVDAAIKACNASATDAGLKKETDVAKIITALGLTPGACKTQ